MHIQCAYIWYLRSLHSKSILSYLSMAPPTLHLKFQSGHGDLDDNRNRWFPAWEECCHRSMDFTYLQTPNCTKTQHLDKISHILESLCWRVRHWLRHMSSGNKTPKVSPSSHHMLEKGLFHIGGPFNLLSSFHWPHVESGIFRCMATIHPVDQDGPNEGRPKAYCCGQKIACKNYKGLLECG